MNQDSDDIVSSMNADFFLKAAAQQILDESSAASSRSLFNSDFMNPNTSKRFTQQERAFSSSNRNQQPFNSYGKRFNNTNNKQNKSYNPFAGGAGPAQGNNNRYPSQGASYPSFGYHGNNNSNNFGQLNSAFPNSFNNYGNSNFNNNNNNYNNSFGANSNNNSAFFAPNSSHQTDNNGRWNLYNNRKDYVKANKAQNIHRLWPHTESAKTSRPNSEKFDKSKHETLTASKAGQSEQDNSNKVVDTETAEKEPMNKGDSQVEGSDSLKTTAVLKSNSDADKNGSKSEESDKTSANIKTGMCLINELVKMNKIKHEFTLLDEIGPAHKKTFYVQLKLGLGNDVTEEVYVANGTSIKKAQQNVSEIAYNQTKFKRPALSTRDKPDKESAVDSGGKKKSLKNGDAGGNRPAGKKQQASLAPTVMLNALAMKLELKPMYTPMSSNATAASQSTRNDHYNRNFGYNNYSSNYQPPAAYQPPVNKMPHFYNNNNYTNFTSSHYKPFVYQTGATHFAPVNLYANNASNENNNNNFRSPWGGGNDFKGFNRVQRPFVNDRQGPGQFAPQKCVVKLKFAEKEFEGEGVSVQAARHAAAAKALDHFSQIENYNKAKQLAEQQQALKKKESSPPSDPAAITSSNPVASDSAAKITKSPETTTTVSKPETSESINPSSILPATSDLKEKPKFTILARRQSAEENKNGTDAKKDEKSTPVASASSEPPKSDKEAQISEINILNDYVNILRKNVKYELVSESGPSHAKKFVTRCTVDTRKEPEAAVASSFPQTVMSKISANAPTTFETIGEGVSKKVSKLNAAIGMLKIIKEHFEPIILMHQPPPRPAYQKHSNTTKKKQVAKSATTTVASSSVVSESAAASDGVEKKRGKASNIDKIKKTTPEYGKGTINAISRLIQIQQARQDPEPVFEFISSSTTNGRYRGNFPGGGAHDGHFTHKRHEFVFQCIIKKKRTPPSALNVDEAASTAVVTEPVDSWEVLKTEGKATTKKNAKKNAAEAMLIKIGYQPLTPALKPALKTSAKNESSVLNNETRPELSKKSPELSSEATESTDQQEESRPESSASSPGSSDGGKGEKHVKFSAEVLVEKTDDGGEVKAKPKRINKKLSSGGGVQKPPKVANQNADEHQKINVYKEKLLEMNRSHESMEQQVMFDSRDMLACFKIASELLESIEKQAAVADTSTDNQQAQQSEDAVVEFYSETAKRLLDEQRAELAAESSRMKDPAPVSLPQLPLELNNNCAKDVDAPSRLLTGNVINYKRALDYLANVLKFKVVYQSLLSRDGLVNSYVSLPILSNSEKSIHGQGSTYHESSNVAAHNALKYLSSRKT